MIPKTIPSAGSFKDNLVFNQLIRDMDANVVFELSNKRAILGFFTRLLSQKGGAQSISVATNEIQSANIGLDHIQATIQSSTAVGNQLVITFTQPVEAARVGDKAFYNGRWDRGGLVVAATNGVGGSITIEPLYQGLMSFSSDFPVGGKIILYGDLRPNTVSSPKARRFLNPEIDVNYLSTKREGIWNARYEKVSTRVSTNGQQQNVFEFNGQWWTAQQQQAIFRLEMAKEFDIAFSKRDIYTKSDGEYSTNGGVRWSVINRGGVYAPFTSTITEDFLYDFFGKISDQNLGADVFMFAGGRGIWAAICDIFKDSVKETGELNTFGGQDVSGYNIKTFSIPGLTTKPIAYAPVPLFNDPDVNSYRTTIPGYTGFTTTQMTAMVFTDAMQSWDGQSLPQFLRYHFGKREYHVGRLKGMDSAGDLSMSSTMFQSAMEGGDGSIDDVATLQDVTEISILTQSGIDGYGRGCGWLEPII